MKRKFLGTAVAVVMLAALAAAQQAEQYLDIFVVQVKPEKRADFDAVVKKMVAANQGSKGDAWLAIETVYGPAERVTFVSQRQNYADAEKGTEMFAGALQKAYGKMGADKLLQDFNQCIVNGRSEFRRRRWDLSSNAPANDADNAKLVGGSRYLRTVAVYVHPGQIEEFESVLKDLKEAHEKASQTVLVSQAVAGQEGTVFYFTRLENSLAGLDSMHNLRQLLGDEGYQKFMKVNAESVSHTETVISRFVPELSNPPDVVAAAAPEFWHPQAIAAKAAKPKAPIQNASEVSKAAGKK
jgi:quinol monooxygenase YgiN